MDYNNIHVDYNIRYHKFISDPEQPAREGPSQKQPASDIC